MHLKIVHPRGGWKLRLYASCFGKNFSVSLFIIYSKLIDFMLSFHLSLFITPSRLILSITSVAQICVNKPFLFFMNGSICIYKPC